MAVKLPIDWLPGMGQPPKLTAGPDRQLQDRFADGYALALVDVARWLTTQAETAGRDAAAASRMRKATVALSRRRLAGILNDCAYQLGGIRPSRRPKCEDR